MRALEADVTRHELEWMTPHRLLSVRRRLDYP
jgi:hypothetical protein